MAMETISLHGPGMFSRWAHGVAFETGRPEVDQLDPGVMDVTWRRQHGWLSGPRLLCLASMKIIENPRWSDILIHYYPLLSTIVHYHWKSTMIHYLSTWSSVKDLLCWSGISQGQVAQQHILWLQITVDHRGLPPSSSKSMRMRGVSHVDEKSEDSLGCNLNIEILIYLNNGV